MKKFLLILFIVLLVLALIVSIALLIASSVQNISPAIQWQNWMQAIGFIKKPVEEISTSARFLL